MLVMAAVEEHAPVPGHTRSTGSPLHDPREDVQSAPVPAVLLHPTVTDAPTVQVKVPALRQPHSRSTLPQVASVHAAVIMGAGPVSTPASTVPPRQRVTSLCSDAHAGKFADAPEHEGVVPTAHARKAFTGAAHEGGSDESAPHIPEQLTPLHPGVAASTEHTRLQRSVGEASGPTVASGRTLESGGVDESMGGGASGVTALSGRTLASGCGDEMHAMSIDCCDMHEVKFGVSPEHTIWEVCAQAAKAALSEAQALPAEKSVEQPVMQLAVSALHPLVMATRAQSVAQVPGSTVGLSVAVEASSMGVPPPPPPPPRALQAARASAKVRDVRLLKGRIARSYAGRDSPGKGRTNNRRRSPRVAGLRAPMRRGARRLRPGCAFRDAALLCLP